MEIRVKKKPSLRKNKESQLSQMSMTTSAGMFSTKDVKQVQLPPLRHNMRKTSAKFNPKKRVRQETQTTAMQSSMFVSECQMTGKGWVQSNQYLKEIQDINLIRESQLQLSDYEVRLNEKLGKNMAKIDSLFELMEQWTVTLRKLTFHLGSRKSNTGQLIEEVKFWRILCKKFDQVEYELNTVSLVNLMSNSLHTKPEARGKFEQFLSLRAQVVGVTPMLQRLYMTLEESVSGKVQKLQENSDIVSSIQLLKSILLAVQMASQSNELLRTRLCIIYEKINDCMVQKLIAAPICPRELANISSMKQKYCIIDNALSFYSNFLAVLENRIDQTPGLPQFELIVECSEHTRSVLVNLLQILGYFQYLYEKKQVLEFSKLFSHTFSSNIFEHANADQWQEFIEKVTGSMVLKNYEP